MTGSAAEVCLNLSFPPGRPTEADPSWYFLTKLYPAALAALSYN